MAPQKRTMGKRGWVKVGKVITKRSHPIPSVRVELARQTPSTKGRISRHPKVVLLKPTGRYMIISSAGHASIHDDFQVEKQDSTKDEFAMKLKHLTDEFHLRTKIRSYIFGQQQLLFVEFMKIWEEYLKHCESHA